MQGEKRKFGPLQPVGSVFLFRRGEKETAYHRGELEGVRSTPRDFNKENDDAGNDKKRIADYR